MLWFYTVILISCFYLPVNVFMVFKCRIGGTFEKASLSLWNKEIVGKLLNVIVDHKEGKE